MRVQDDFLLLFLKNFVPYVTLSKISRLCKDEQFSAIDELRSLFVNGYLSGDRAIWGAIKIYPDGHKYGPWEFID